MARIHAIVGTPAAHDFGLLLVRLMVGVVGVFHGGQKLFGLFGGSGIEGFAKFLESLNVPLPLVSYGGTSMVTLMAGFGILMSLHSHRKLISS